MDGWFHVDAWMVGSTWVVWFHVGGLVPRLTVDVWFHVGGSFPRGSDSAVKDTDVATVL